MKYTIGNQKVKTEQQGDILKVWVYGTNEIKDIPTSILFWENLHGFHYGAYLAAEKILEHPGLLDAISGKTVIIGGISMGGGIAECMANICYTRGLCRVKAIVLYGSFPVDSEKILICPIIRFHKEFDVVPKLFKLLFKNTGVIFDVKSDFRDKWPRRFYLDHCDYSFDYFWALEGD